MRTIKSVKNVKNICFIEFSMMTIVLSVHVQAEKPGETPIPQTATFHTHIWDLTESKPRELGKDHILN